MTAVTVPTPVETDDAGVARPRNIWPIMCGVLLVLLLSSLDQTIVATAMPRVIAQLNGFDRYAWVATAYLITSTVTVPIFGKLSDVLGRKLIFLLGIIVFLLGSALCGLAQTMTQLILFRGLQGVGAGVLVPVATAVVGDLFPPKERGKWQGVAGAVWGFAALVGPTVGGIITDAFSWRWIFYVNLPVGVLALVILGIMMPPLRNNRSGARVDMLGAFVLIVGTVPLLLAFTWAGTTYPWGSGQIVGLLAVSIGVLGFFMAYEARHAEPVIEPRLFKNRIFTVCVLATMLISAGRLGSVIFVSLFIQSVMGAAATRSGVLLTALLVMAVGGSVISGQLMSRWGRYRYIGLAGLLLMLIGTALLLRLDAQTRPTAMLPALLLLGGGIGFGMSIYSIAVQNAFPAARLGQVTSALAFFRSIGGTIGVAVLGSVLTTHFADALRSAPPTVTPATWRHVVAQVPALHNPRLLLQPHERAIMERAFVHLGPQGQHLYAVVLAYVKAALAGALHDVFMVELAIAGLAFLIVLFLPEVALRGREAVSDVAQSASGSLSRVI